MTTLKQKIIIGFITIQIIAALALASAFYIETWLLELMVSFAPILSATYTVVLAISSIILFIQRPKWSPVAISTVVSAWIIAAILTAHLLTAQPPTKLASSSAPDITFATFNKLNKNRDLESFTEFISQHNVDVVALQEVNANDMPRIADLLGFEYNEVSRPFSSSGNSSVALFSRYPFSEIETIELATDHPVVRGVIELPNGKEAAFYSVHIPIPLTSSLYSKRNIVFDSLSEAIASEEIPIIIGGDFNTTIYSPTLRTFSDETSQTIKPISLSRLPECSWYGFGSALCIRIDHIFIPTSASVSSLIVSTDFGSDHRMLIAEINL